MWCLNTFIVTFSWSTFLLTLTTCAKQVHWKGCNDLSSRSVSHVLSIWTWSKYHFWKIRFSHETKIKIWWNSAFFTNLHNVKNPQIICYPFCNCVHVIANKGNVAFAQINPCSCHIYLFVLKSLNVILDFIKIIALPQNLKMIPSCFLHRTLRVFLESSPIQK